MALALLSGSNANIDISIGAASVKCGFGRWVANIVRGATGTTTFCSTGWIEEQTGSKQLLGRLDGYGSTGVAWSDPLIWVTAASTLAFILTATTSCTLTFAGNIFGDGVEMVAALNSGRGVDFRSSGAVTSAWVVA